MALRERSSASHNKMLGHRIPHPPSTNFDESFDIPPAKRLKRFDSISSPLSQELLKNDEVVSSPSNRSVSCATSDSEDGIDEEENLLQARDRVGLETALPLVATDKEAIAEYEATRSAQNQELGLHGDLGQKKWLPGKSSIYVDAFNLALETVLEDESHLFNAPEMEVFENWRKLDYECQYL